MKLLKYGIVFALIICFVVSVAAKKPPRGVKPSDAYIKAVKIAMLANPPRYEEALGFLDTVITFHGPLPEAYFYKGNIFADYATKTYDLQEKLTQIKLMSQSYDSMKIGCESNDVEKKHRKDCDKYAGIVDSIGQYYWRDNYNHGVKIIERLDGELRERLNNAADSTEEEAARAAMRATADSGIAYFAIAYTVLPENLRSLEGTALIYDRMQQYDSALVYYKKVYDVTPDSLSAIQNLAYGYIQIDDWANSIVYFKKFLELVPNEANIMFNIAICYSNMGMPDSAYAYNLKAITADPEMITPYLQIGSYFLIKSQHYSDSIMTYQKEENSEMAAKYIKLRDAALDSSSIFLKTVVEKEPENAIALEQYGLVSMVLDRNEEALVAYQKLAEMEPNRKDNWVNIGDCLVRTEQFTEAIPAYEKVVEIDPGNLRVWELLVDLYKSEKMTAKAAEAEAKVTELKNL
ncbi:MAG: hypothetical protein JW763_04135 [candidate division Zixibacteria bacterium]|nr:hypothetical protein [candidate division Zixibacteria bacterium]